MKIDLLEVGRSPILAGAMNGRMALNRLLEAASSEADDPEPIFLDFSDIDVATASFLRESVLAFREIIRKRKSNFYPVIANANDVVQDELLEVLRARGEAIMICSLEKDENVSNVFPLGELDPKQRITFDLVRRHGITDAGELMREYGQSEGTKHTTAWNNRLSSLSSLGLVIEDSQGRSKRYRPLFEGS